MRVLPPPHRALPQVLTVVTAPRQGVVAHHVLLLPTVKELVETAFVAGHTPTLFATDTFAVGGHAPVRTVVFGALAKFSRGGYLPLSRRGVDQMAGRAGRRGTTRPAT